MPHKHINFCITEHFFKAFQRKRLFVIMPYLFLNRSTGRSSAKSVCVHLANWVLIVIKLFQRAVEAGADIKEKGRHQLQERAIPAPGMKSHIFQLKARMQKNPEGNSCYHSWVQHLKYFISKQAFS